MRAVLSMLFDIEPLPLFHSVYLAVVVGRSMPIWVNKAKESETMICEHNNNTSLNRKKERENSYATGTATLGQIE